MSSACSWQFLNSNSVFSSEAVSHTVDISCSFGLLEGMSAIEMMDPKMDAGMVCNQTKRKVLNFQQAIQVIMSYLPISRSYFSSNQSVSYLSILMKLSLIYLLFWCVLKFVIYLCFFRQTLLSLMA